MTNVRRQDSSSFHNNRRVSNDCDSETSHIGLFVSPLSQNHPRSPSDASDKPDKTSVTEGERIETIDNGDFNFTEQDIETQERFCDATDTDVQEEDIPLFWDDQSDGVKYYLVDYCSRT